MSAREPLALAKEALAQAQKEGASLAETYLLEAKNLSIEVAEQKVETMKLAEERGLGVRVFKNNQLGFAYTSDLSSEAIRQAVTQAIANSSKTHPDPYNKMAAKFDNYPSLELFDPGIRKAAVEEKIELAKRIEREAKAFDSRIKITENSSYSDSEYLVTIVNSLGLEATCAGSYCAAYAFLVSEENGDNQNGFGLQYSLKYRDLDPVTIGREAAENAVRMLGAKKIKTQRATIVLDPRVATGFLGLLAPSLTGEAVQKGKSLFANKIGQPVASDKIVIVDDGALEGAIMSSPFDGEGVPSSRTVLVDKGILKGFLHNVYTANKDGIESTGNGVRGSFKGTPEVGITNFYIEPGKYTKDQLIGEIDTGLYVTEVMGMHTANPVSGDFSLGAAGIWIENGKFTYPVRGVAIAGNIVDLLTKVNGVADDLKFLGGKGSPTIRIEEMTISGS